MMYGVLQTSNGIPECNVILWCIRKYSVRHREVHYSDYTLRRYCKQLAVDNLCIHDGFLVIA